MGRAGDGQKGDNEIMRAITSDREHRRLLKLLMKLDEMDHPTPDEEAFAEVLTRLIEDYEEKQNPFPRVSPSESLKALMEERGVQQNDIAPLLGNTRRAISKAQAKRLAEFFRVPVDLFI